ncbi:MAG: DoxX family protein [Pseudomonadota bacterium]
MVGLIQSLQKIITSVGAFLASISLRVYLAPIFIAAGGNKLANAEGVAQWFASLGLPAPELMVYLAGGTEFIGGWLLLAGVAVRWICIPLMFTMVVAAGTAHWENGWHVAPETELTAPWEWREDLIEGAVERRSRARALLRRHGNYDYLTESGSITINKNGIEWAATYFVMLMALMALGAGKFLSVDYWVGRFFPRQ